MISSFFLINIKHFFKLIKDKLIEEVQGSLVKAQQENKRLEEQKREVEASLGELRSKAEQVRADLEKSNSSLNAELQKELEKKRELAVELSEKESCLKENETKLSRFQAEIDELNEQISGEKKKYLSVESDLDDSVIMRFGMSFSVLV